jgi:hypothetical protein
MELFILLLEKESSKTNETYGYSIAIKPMLSFLSSICFQARWGHGHAAYRLRQGSINAKRVGTEGLREALRR